LGRFLSKPNIEIPHIYLDMVPDPKKFGTIKASPYHAFHYAEPKEDLLDIRIWDGKTPMGEFAAAASARQTYIIFPAEYETVRAQGDPYAEIHGPKLVFTKDLHAAIYYALGLLEKGALYGIWADLHNA
jgi:hypothetical protein